MTVWNKYRRDPDFQSYVHESFKTRFGRDMFESPAQTEEPEASEPPTKKAKTAEEEEWSTTDDEADENPEDPVHEVEGEHGLEYHLDDVEDEF